MPSMMIAVSLKTIHNGMFRYESDRQPMTFGLPVNRIQFMSRKVPSWSGHWSCEGLVALGLSTSEM